MKTSNLLDVELKTWVIRMLSELHENFKKEIVSIKQDMESIKKKTSQKRRIH